jgi:hypothetical protein
MQEFKNKTPCRNTVPERSSDCHMVVKTSYDLVIYYVWKSKNIINIKYEISTTSGIFSYYRVRDLHVKIHTTANLITSLYDKQVFPLNFDSGEKNFKKRKLVNFLNFFF